MVGRVKALLSACHCEIAVRCARLRWKIRLIWLWSDKHCRVWQSDLNWPNICSRLRRRRRVTSIAVLRPRMIPVISIQRKRFDRPWCLFIICPWPPALACQDVYFLFKATNGRQLLSSASFWPWWLVSRYLAYLLFESRLCELAPEGILSPDS